MDPYQSPTVENSERTKVPSTRPLTLVAAAMAGVRFAIKWVTIIIGPILILAFIGALGLFVFRAVMQDDLSQLFGPERRWELAQLVGLLIGIYVLCCFWISAFSAVAYSVRYLLTKKEENQP